METITSAAELKIAIQRAELERDVQGQILKEHFILTFESFTPVNLIKNALNDVATSPYLIDNMIGSAMGLITGYLSKKIAIGSSNNLFKNLLGSVLQFGVTNIVAQHPEVIKSVGRFLINQITHKKEAKTEKS